MSIQQSVRTFKRLAWVHSITKVAENTRDTKVCCLQQLGGKQEWLGTLKELRQQRLMHEHCASTWDCMSLEAPNKRSCQPSTLLPLFAILLMEASNT